MSGSPFGPGPADPTGSRDAAELLAQIRNRVERLEEQDNPDPPNIYRVEDETVEVEDTVEVTLS